jgi:hypothetical protein
MMTNDEIRAIFPPPSSEKDDPKFYDFFREVINNVEKELSPEGHYGGTGDDKVLIVNLPFGGSIAFLKIRKPASALEIEQHTFELMLLKKAAPQAQPLKDGIIAIGSYRTPEDAENMVSILLVLFPMLKHIKRMQFCDLQVEALERRKREPNNN